MCNQHRLPTSLLRLAAILPTTLALTTFLCPPQSIAQIILGNVISELDIPQSVPGTCDNYDSVLHATGVLANGRPHRDRCRSTALTPLFNGMQLGSNMQSFLGSQHPPLFTIQTTHEKGKYCAVNSKLRAKLTASLLATALQWTSAPPVGSACDAEVTRVNKVSSLPPSPAVLLEIRDTVLKRIGQELERSPQLSGCGFTPAAARLALDQQVWTLLERAANEEIAAFEASVAPAIDPGSACAAKCNLCVSGWVGSIHCTATVDDPSYHWNETQSWDVGGLPSAVMGGKTNYPANFTATGKGSKQGASGWIINATQMGTLTDGGVNANKRFSTSNDVVPKGIIWTDGSLPPSGLGEMQVKFNADQVGGSTASNDPMPTLPTCMNTQQRPPSIPCNVSCTWNLVKQ
jgi:hypothetical protein